MGSSSKLNLQRGRPQGKDYPFKNPWSQHPSATCENNLMSVHAQTQNVKFKMWVWTLRCACWCKMRRSESGLQPQRKKKTKKNTRFVKFGGLCWGLKTLWRAVASLHQRTDIASFHCPTSIKELFMHMLRTLKKTKSTSQFRCVRRCGSVWFRDVLLWYDRGWIPVLVVLKKQFHKHEQTKTSEETSKHTYCNASHRGERMERITKHKYYILFIYIGFFLLLTPCEDKKKHH